MRPPGYEPGELPTAPLRDIIVLRVQRYAFFLIYTNNSLNIFKKYAEIWRIQIKMIILHTTIAMCNLTIREGARNVNIENKTKTS